jgi:hypothetical protein
MRRVFLCFLWHCLFWAPLNTEGGTDGVVLASLKNDPQ